MRARAPCVFFAEALSEWQGDGVFFHWRIRQKLKGQYASCKALWGDEMVVSGQEGVRGFSQSALVTAPKALIWRQESAWSLGAFEHSAGVDAALMGRRRGGEKGLVGVGIESRYRRRYGSMRVGLDYPLFSPRSCFPLASGLVVLWSVECFL